MNASRGWMTVLIIGLIYLAILFTLVRPKSQGPALITSVSNGLANLIKSATGGGTWG